MRFRTTSSSDSESGDVHKTERSSCNELHADPPLEQIGPVIQDQLRRANATPTITHQERQHPKDIENRLGARRLLAFLGKHRQERFLVLV